jgi:hypothetical protein
MAMKSLVGFAVLALSFAVPAYAQAHAAGGGGAGLPVNSGGGGVGGAESGAAVRLPHYSRAKFQVTAVSGSETDYIPSTFVSYNKALTTGHTTVASAPETLGQAAQLNRQTPRVKAKFALVQDGRGRAVIEPR